MSTQCSPTPQTLAEKIGWLLGFGIGLGTGLGSLIRQARVFHPRGILVKGSAEAIENPIHAGIEGPVLVRWSSAWWKNKEWIDILGCAIRFEGQDQDLLFATIRYPWTLPISPFTTDYRDFYQNTFYGISPFELPGNEKVELRLRAYSKSDHRFDPGVTRAERFFHHIRNHSAHWILEMRRLQEGGASVWTEVSRIELTEAADSSLQEELRFSPFRAGLGIHPSGFIQYLRLGAYQMSQALRPKK